MSATADAPAEEQRRGAFSSRKVFILAAIGSAVGLGNIWRFPYVAYENGGGAFILPYLVALLTAGIPFLLLDYALGHRNRGSAPLSFARTHRRTEWLGWWQVGICFVIAVYYAAVIAWAVRWNRQEKARRAQADREIERYRREHPDQEVTDEVRRAYYRYRSAHRTGPPDTPEKGRDEDGVEREMRYAPTFHAWFPLYMTYPALYSGQSGSGWGGSGTGTSFGGGGGFSGGGATGSF